MQNSILLSDAQVRPAGISVEEGINTLKCEIKKLAKTKSETFSYICEETVTYGEVVLTMVGFAETRRRSRRLIFGLSTTIPSRATATKSLRDTEKRGYLREQKQNSCTQAGPKTRKEE